MLNSDLYVETFYDAGDITIYKIGKIFIYQLDNATIYQEGHIPINVSLRKNAYSIGKAYVNGSDIPVMLWLGTIGNIYVSDLSANIFSATTYVRGIIIGVSN